MEKDYSKESNDIETQTEPYMTNSNSNSQFETNEITDDDTTAISASCLGVSFTCSKIKKSKKKTTPKLKKKVLKKI